MVRKLGFATIAWLLLSIMAAPVSAAESASPRDELDRDLRSIDPSEHIKALSSHPSRYTGYPGCYEAQKYIRNRFEELGLANVRETPFQAVVPIVPDDERWGKKVPEAERGPRPDHGGTLSVGGREIPLYCVLPNFVRTSMTSEDGIAGELVWVGDGYLRDFNGKNVMGSIVLMDFNSVTRWLNAANAGASAVIFVETEHPFRSDAEQKYIELPIPVPRYYLQRKQLPALAAAVAGGEANDYTPAAAQAVLSSLGTGAEEPTHANVKALMRWEEMDVVRVSAEMPGTDPHLNGQSLVVFAYYDGVSVVPALSPGAEGACGVSTLLEIAEFLAKHPPRRKVKFIAAPGHYQALLGVRDYAFKTIYPRREGADEDAKQGTGEPYFFIGLDLSSRHNSMGAFFKGHFYDHPPADWENKEVDLQSAYSEYSGLISEWADYMSRPGGPAETLRYQSGIVPQEGRDWRSLVPDLVAFDSEVITLCGYPAITLATTGDPRNSVSTPLDTFERMEPYVENVRRQAAACAYIVKQTADVPVLPVERGKSWKHRKAASLFGFSIELSLLAYMPKVPVRNAVAVVNMLAPGLSSSSKSMMGVSTYDFRLSNVQGLFEVPGLLEDKWFRVDGFRLSPSTGAVSKISRSELVQATARAREADWAERETDLRLNFFRAVSTTVFDLTDPLSLFTLDRSTAVRGDSNSELQYLVQFVGQESLSDPFSKPCAVFFTKRDKNVKFLLAGTAVDYEGLLLNFEGEETGERLAKKERTGIGYKANENENFIYMTGLQVARDMHALDGYRMDRLRRSGIYKRRVEDLYGEAGRHLEEAERDLEAQRYDDFQDKVRSAWGLENRVYPDVRDTSTDVVTGVV
ncbi:MAG: M28 family peptidase, partial [Planctomycetota bacterium]